MPSPGIQRELSLVKVTNPRSLRIGFILCTAIFCLVVAMLILTRIGSADAGIGQPVTLGPPQNLPAGSKPNSITSFSNDFENIALTILNDGSDTLTLIQQSEFGGSFDQSTTYALPAGARPQSVSVGTRRPFFSVERFLVVADTGINKVSVLLRQSPNVFQPPVHYDVGTAPQDVAVGHLTNDNNMDIATANFGSDNVTVLSGKADGTFDNFGTFSVSAKPRAIALGTIDDNFFQDIVTCNSDAGGGKVNVLLASGGSFLPAVTYNVGSDPFDVAVADFNRDGKQDVVTANNGSNNVSILLNNGAGSFMPVVSYPAGLNPRSVAVADLNLDGWLDLAVASAGNGLNLLLNNGDGTFATAVNFSMGQTPVSVVVNRFSRDGVPDIATANNGSGTISIRNNQTVPSVTFATPSPTPINSKPHSVAAFSRFGKPGLAVTNNDANDSGVSVLYKSNVFSDRLTIPTYYPLLAGSQPEQVVVGNLGGQISLPSLVIALPNANKVGILLGNSDDSFQSPVYKDVGTFPRSVALADFNSDGRLDIATANFGGGTISMLFGNADRSFQNAITVANVVSANPEFIVAGDFNNDGKADIATCSSGLPDHNKVNVLRGNGNGTFQPATSFNVGLTPQFMTTGDFNQDGKLDLAVSASGENKVSVLLNTGNGVFQQPATHYPVGLDPNSIFAGDFNLDGRTDLVVTNGQGGTFSVLLNNGDGTFKSSLSFVVGLGPIGITAGNFNSDNKPDIVTANHDDGTLSLIFNTTPTPPLPPPANDNFANAETISGFSGQVLGTNLGATVEIGEPAHNPSNSSVWYSWTAPANGGVMIDTFESTFNTVLAVYAGNSLNNLTQIASNNDDLSAAGDSRISSKVTFNAVSGTTYKLAVAGFSEGNLSLNWNLLPAPANDNFANAQTISGASGVVVGVNAGATKEQGEPNHADDPGGSSIWYRWTAPSSGTFTFNTSSSKISCDASLAGCGYDTLLAIYKGASLQEISQAQNLVAKNDNAAPLALTSLVSFNAVAGTTYRIALDSKGGNKSDIVLSWLSGTGQTASFANAITISGFSGDVITDVGSNGEIWFRWVAPAGGSVTFTSGIFANPQKSTFQYPSTLSLYSVSGQSTLSPISTNTGTCQVSFGDRFCQPSTVNLSAVAQTVYAVQIVKPTESSGPARLSWNLSGAPPAPPANDNFAAAQVISGFNTGFNTIIFNNTDATKEAGEPNHGGNPGGRSLWYSWKAPATFRVTFSTFAFSGQTIFVNAYTGSSVSNLTSLAGGSSATFDAVKDTTYHIAVDSVGPGSGTLFWNPAIAPPNDNFLNAQFLNVNSGKALGTNINATEEAGEPQHRTFSVGPSIWYSWTATQNGLITFNTDGSDIDTLLAIYSGSVLNSLSPVISNDTENPSPFVNTSRVTFFALAGRNYKIAVTSSGGGTIRLQWGLPRSLGGRVTNIRGVGIANVIISLDGDGKRKRATDAQGFYSFPDVPGGGAYVVTPATTSYTYDFTDRSYNPLTANITDANFVALTPVYSISGRITAGGVGVSNVTLNLTGTINSSVSTNAQGFYEFPDLTTGGNYTVTPSSTSFAFSAFSILKDRYFFPALNDNYTGVDFTAVAVRKLTVASSNPNSGVSITVAPADNDDQGIGPTPFTRTYNLNINVTLTAPATSGSNVFQKWLKNGVDYSTSVSTNLSLDASHTMTAVYLTTTVQTPAGQNRTVQLNGVTVQFANVTTAGTTTILPISPAAAGQLPTGFQLTGNSIAFDISTTAVVKPPITVCFNLPSITDATVFGLLRLLHNENGTLVDRTSSQNFASKTICASVNSLSPFVLASVTVQQLQLLLEEPAGGSNQVAAVDALSLVRDPFPVLSETQLLIGTDLNTRVVIFVGNLQLAAGETPAAVVVHLVGANGQSYDVPAENLRSLTGLNFRQVTFRLPDTLVPGNCTIEVRAHSQVSNIGTIRIRM